MDTKTKQLALSYGLRTAFALLAVLIFYFVTGGRLPDLSTRKDAGVNPDVNPVTIQDIKNQDADSKLLAEFEAMNQISIYRDGLITPRSLIDACRDQAKSAACNSEVAKITQIIKTSGKIEKAYLYVKAGVSRDEEPLAALTRYDSLWYYITNDFEENVTDAVTYGGHLLRSKALVQRVAGDGATELLFDLSQLPVTTLPYSDSNAFAPVDVLDVLNRPGRHFTGGFVSTLGHGEVLDLRIGYTGGLIEDYPSAQ